MSTDYLHQYGDRQVQTGWWKTRYIQVSLTFALLSIDVRMDRQSLDQENKLSFSVRIDVHLHGNRDNYLRPTGWLSSDAKRQAIVW